ncbi:nitrogen fixation protein FixH [Pseudorhodobacter turbinis]|uniref:Nitrogen fixation protein FixH n=1 Tax=Pseudorhodobacter turbinis TaxID=2500533 RepID=A0A4P8EGJ2_9RHOB|nr:FixH family protein [Pseudorhodobacter turbinis]QCO56008.1 nitrogen fixation protein FixH [Pseudorhodobacter turbinis]
MTDDQGFRITGRKVLFFTVGAFGIIIAVNLLMAYKAISTFPGLEVKNSYVASQTFDADRSAQIGLGWTLAPEYDAKAKQLRLAFTDEAGYPAEVSALSVLIGRTTEASDDMHPEFVRESGVFVASLDLAMGKWMMQIEATAPDGTVFRQRIDLSVRG